VTVKDLKNELPERRILILEEMLMMLREPERRENFERLVPSAEEMKIFVDYLKLYKGDIIKHSQRSEVNRELVWKKFNKINEHVYLGDVQRWNSWRGKIDITGEEKAGFKYNSEEDNLWGHEYLYMPTVDLSFRDLTQVGRGDFPEIDLDKSNLSGAILDECNLKGSYLEHSILAFTSLKGVLLDHSHLRGSRIIISDFGGGGNPRKTIYGIELEGLAHFEDADFEDTLVIGTDLRYGRFDESKFISATMPYMDFRNGSFFHCDFTDAYMPDVCLQGADLRHSTLVRTNLARANISGAKVFGAGVARVNLEGTIQKDLIVTPDGEPVITADDLYMAQDISNFLENKVIGRSIETWKDKAVTIFGSFHPDEQKSQLLKIKDKLREKNYLPIVYDFTRPANQPNIKETSTTLARLSKFIIIDLTSSGKETKKELEGVASGVPSVVVVPILRKGEAVPSNFNRLKESHKLRILDPVEYRDSNELFNVLDIKVIGAAEVRLKELRSKY